MLKLWKQKTQFRQTLASFLIILLIPSIITLLICFRAAGVIRDDLKDARALSFERRTETLASFLSRLDMYVYEISRNPYISDSLFLDRTKINSIKLLYNLRNLPSVYAFTPMSEKAILDKMIFMNRSGLVVCKSSIYDSSVWYYDYKIYGYGISEWQSMIAAGDGSTIRYYPLDLEMDGIHRKSLVYISALPLGYDASENAVVICLNSDYLVSQLIGDETDTFVRVFDENNNLLLEGGSPETGKTTTHTFVSAYNGWTYEWEYPYASLMSDMAPTLSVIAILLAFLLCIAPLIAVYMAWRHNQPVRRLAGMLSEKEQQKKLDNSTSKDMDNESRETFEFIQKGVQELLDQKQTLEERITENRALVYNAALHQLLSNRSSADRTTISMLRSYAFPVWAKTFTVADIRLYDNITAEKLETLENLQIQQSVLIDAIQNETKLLVHVYDNSNLALFLFDCEEDEIRRKLEDLSENLAARGHSNVHIGVGNTMTSLFDCHRSFAQARQALYLSDPGSTVSYYSKIVNNGAGTLYFPPSEEQKLLHLIHAGQENEACTLMEQLLRLSDSGEQDTGDRHTPMIENVLRDSLRITLIKALIDGSRCDEKQRDQALEELFLHPQNMSGEMTDWLITQTHKVCRCFNKGQHSRMDDVIGDVLEYLEGLYANPNISLSSTAEHFRISEAYLSHQFKEQTGENFGSCLERIRQNHAHTLLTQTSLSIEDISMKVGYSSADTFRKAFKQYHGINPAKYRELNQK